MENKNVNLDPNKVFDKALWLAAATKKRDAGILTDQDIANAEAQWVDDMHGKTVAELTIEGKLDYLREDWLRDA